MKPLYGHHEAVAAFRDALHSGRLHHSWLIAGPQGVGKALFADKAAARVLAEGAGLAAEVPDLDVPASHATAKLLAAGSHPDFLRIERLTKDSGTELARSITVDQIRRLQRLFATTPSLSRWRAVVIDAVDDLERGGANALLKNLEEPPANTVFLLVSHAPERLLPTIRSRCRMLRLGRLRPDAALKTLRDALPDAEEAEIAELAALSEGLPGQALDWRGLNIAALDDAMQRILASGDPNNALRARLADSLSVRSAQPRYEAFLARTPSFIAKTARTFAGADLARALQLWERARDLSASAVPLSLDPHAVVFELAGMVAALSPNDQRRTAS